jgi:antitoxin ChpS
MTVTVKKLGGSVAVVIPKAMAQELRLMEGTPLEVSTDGTTITMQRRRSRPRRPLGKLLAQIKPASYRRRRAEAWDDAPVGKEIW